MLNTSETYKEAGRRAAIARNQRDEGRYQFERDWFNRARNMETASDQDTARAAYESGFSEARNLPAPCRFR